MMTAAPEALLHRLGPYLPTDRFRALLAGTNLEEQAVGAAMFVDISGFTPLTVRLVEQYGPQRASEELKRRLNPMFEAIAGQVFTHGGSVIRFVGDGFTAWFPDDLPHLTTLAHPLPGAVRAAVAAVEMLEMMAFFRDLDIKVAISAGTAKRWVVGNPEHGLVDILAGDAVETVAEVSNRYLKHEARAHANAAAILADYQHVHSEPADENDVLLKRVSSVLVEQSRAHRWSAWQAAGDVESVLLKVQQFIDPIILEQESVGLGSISGELRYATPVFLRFKGIDYKNDPQAKARLDAYLEEVQRILHDTRGRLVSLEVADKGSVIFAVFGAPIAHGDDTQRAVHTALAFRELPRKFPYISDQSIGISRGLLYSGTVGGEARHEYTSLGDETNVASRMMSADSQGRILMSEAAYADCGDWFEFEKGDAISPKGRVGIIQTYSPRRIRHDLRRNLRRTPIVGRDAEIETFKKALDVARRGHSRILRIEGDAGIGKSRLAAELGYLAQSREYTLLSGFCLSTGRFQAFIPWRPVLRTLVGISDETSEEQQIIRLSQWLSEHSHDWSPRLPLLGDLLGLAIPDNTTTRSLTGSARQQALFALVVDMLYDSARQKPIVLIIEDTHWLDEVSEALLNELVTHLFIDPAPIIVGIFHRPIEDSEHPTTILKSLAEMYIHQQITLNELSEPAVGQMLMDRLGGIIPPELTRFVFDKSQGNPFFVLEVVDALQETNSITRVGPKVYIDSNLDNTNLPQTVQGLIQARIDNLSEEEKLLLKMAAVIGRQFEMRILYQSLPVPMPTETFTQHLRTLEQRKFSQLDSLYPEPIYSFRHAITQEVAYQTLLYDQRRQWHRTVGTVLEKTQPHSWERLAYHFTRSDDEERAYLYLVRAGEKTATEFANQAALDYWAQALQLSRAPAEQFDLLCKRLELLIRTADLDAIAHDLAQITALNERFPDNVDWQLQHLRYQAEYALDTGDREIARAYAEQGAQLAAAHPDRRLAWEIYSVMSRIYTSLNDTDSKRYSVQRLRAVAEELNDRTRSLQLVLNDTLELAAVSPELARDQLERIYTEVTAQGDPLLEAQFWDVSSQIALQNRELVHAETYLRTQLSLWRQIGNRRMEGNALNNLGRVLYFMGDYSGASAQFGNAFKIFKQLSDLRGEAASLTYLGVVAFRRQAYGEALAYIYRGLANQLENSDHVAAARSFFYMGQVEIAQGNYDSAQGYFLESQRGYELIAMPGKLPQLEVGNAYAAYMQGQTPDAGEIKEILSRLLETPVTSHHDPDLTIWQAVQLHTLIGNDPHVLCQQFSVYVERQLTLLAGEANERFLAIGYTRELLAITSQGNRP